jgi:hypothetical protein
MAEAGTSNFKAFSSWFFSTALALLIIGGAFTFMYSAYGKPSEELIRDFVATYYKAVDAQDQTDVNEHFATDAWFDFDMNFGSMYKPYKVRFRADNEEAFDWSLFEGFEQKATSYTVDKIELRETGANVYVTFKQKYSWSGYDGEMTAQEKLYIGAKGDRYLITELVSVQRYQ